MSVLAGFVKAQSDNLPKIDAISMFSYLGKNPDFIGAEQRGVKAKRSGRESYGDSAIGYVQVKREGFLCTVKAIITPEHKISKTGYGVTVICNEEEEVVLSAVCDGCAAALGGCKHAIAFLAWIHRRSEEPAVTEVTCYWKKSKLSTVGKSLKYIRARDLGKKKLDKISQTNGSFLSRISRECKEMETNTVLTKFYLDIEPAERLSIHRLILDFFQLQQQDSKTASDFLQYCSIQMSEVACNDACIKTKFQHKDKLWHELRYGRITASKAYEGAHCQTMNGSLVECIVGASRLKDTNAMKRGRELESRVRKLLEKKLGVTIVQCGFYTSPRKPIMGASPDGLSDEYVFEIKCPTSEKAMKNYIKSDGTLVTKHYAQIQMQMYFAMKQKGIFCVANPDFEHSKQISFCEVNFDSTFCEELMEKCTSFWKAAIFPLLEQYNTQRGVTNSDLAKYSSKNRANIVFLKNITTSDK